MDSKASSGLQDVFISYGRADSKEFASKLNNRLVSQGLEVWFDFDDIPLGVDYQNQIDDGIERSENFLFLIAPHSVNSPYCRLEIEHALRLNKRIIPLLHVESISRETWQERNPGGTDEDWRIYQEKGLHSSFPNMHPVISKINWVYFREGIDDFDMSLQGLLDIFERQREYVHCHTLLLSQALAWERNQKQAQYLLVGQERQQAERWLKQKFELEQPPCTPTPVHCEFICESIKNANNLMTHVFLSYGDEDRDFMELVRGDLMRWGLTVWSNRTDIQAGIDFQTAINKGIEEADNVIYLISPSSLESTYCREEIRYAQQLNKRIVPLLIHPTDLEEIPEFLRAIQFINFVEEEGEYCDRFNQLLRLLQEEADYYYQHKNFLAKALKWQRNQQNPSLLLRGYSLRHAEAWLKVAHKHDRQGPLVLQEEYITESLRQPPNQSIDVFISYSRADSDFARRLNDALQIQGKTTWFDQESIVAGAADFQTEIFRGIETANHFLFVISPNSIQSPYCAGEVDYAKQFNKRFLTILHRPVNTQEIHPALASVQWIDFSHRGADFSAQFNVLLRALENDPEYLRFHTQLLTRALEWDKSERDESLLLRGKVLQETEKWLLAAEGKSPKPTHLQQDFVTASASEEIRRQRSTLKLQRLGIGAVSVISVVAIALGISAWRSSQVADRQRGKAVTSRERAEAQTILAQTRSSEALFQSGQPFNSLLEAMRAGINLKEYEGHLAKRQKGQKLVHYSEAEIGRSDLRVPVVTALQQAVFWVRERNRLESHEGLIWDVAVSRNGKLIASASADGSAQLWREDGTFVDKIAGPRNTQALSVAFSPSSRQLAVGLENGDILLWQLASERRLLPTGTILSATLRGHSGAVSDLAFSQDGQTLASSSEDATVRLWSLKDETSKELTDHFAAVRSVAFSADGQLFASAGDDRTIRLYNTNGRLLHTLRGHNSEVKGIDFSPDSQRIASASWDETVRIWDRNGRSLKEIRGHDALVYDVAFSPDLDNPFLASASWDKTIKTWTLEGEPISTVFGHSAEVQSVVFNPVTGRLVSGGGDRTIHIWELSRPLLTALRDHEASIYGVAISPDDEVIASAGADNVIRLWNRRDGQPLQTLKGHDSVIWQLNYSPDGEILASASSDYSVKLWNRKGELLNTLLGHRGPVYAVVFSPDGERIATAAADRTIRIWTRDGTPVTEIRDLEKDALTLSFSPDSKMLASAGWEPRIRLWNMQGQLLKLLDGKGDRHRGWIHDVAFSHDGKRIASASADNTAKIWDIKGNLKHTLKGHGDSVMAIRFSHEDDLIATASSDHTVKLWSQKGTLLTTLRGHQGRVNSLSISADEKLLATVGEDRHLLLWDLEIRDDLDKLLTRGCQWIEEYLESSESNLDSAEGPSVSIDAYCQAGVISASQKLR